MSNNDRGLGASGGVRPDVKSNLLLPSLSQDTTTNNNVLYGNIVKNNDHAGLDRNSCISGKYTNEKHKDEIHGSSLHSKHVIQDNFDQPRKERARNISNSTSHYCNDNFVQWNK